ncbi:MAG TPA: DinB family protein [Longimicrobium sp.]|jgi:hypothetical protein
MPDLHSALHAHHQAVQAFLASARAVPPERWDRPRAEGKWSPGQIAEHLALAYEASGEVLHGRSPGGAPPRILRPLLRTLLLRPVLWLGRFPVASKAPGVMRPGTSTAPAPALLDRLQAAAAAFESAAREVRGTTTDHPAFGRLPVVDLVRLQEIHTRHHHLQLPSRAA